MTETKKRALIVVDVQNDFCEGGALAVSGGNQTALRIADFLENGDPHSTYDEVVFTKDWHTPGSDNGGHFSETPDYMDTWPAHCVAFTEGARLHPALRDLQEEMGAPMFRKGQDEPAYSGFQGAYEGQTLNEYLSTRGITNVHVVGIAADYCVRATAEDAIQNGYDTRIIPAFTVSINTPVDEVKAAVDALNEQAKKHRE